MSIGSALVQGFNVGTNSVLNRRKVEILENELRLKNEDARKKGIIEENDKTINALYAANAVSKDGMSIKPDFFVNGFKGNNQSVKDLAVSFANKSALKPANGIITDLELQEDGSFVATVLNDDNTDGVVTENASSLDTDKVVKFTPGQLGDLSNSLYQTQIVANSSKFDPAMLRATLNQIDSDAEAAAFLDTTQKILQSGRIIDQAGQTNNVGFVRAATNAVASVNGKDNESDILSKISEDLGVPNIITDVTKLAPDAGSGLSDDDPRSELTPDYYQMPTVASKARDELLVDDGKNSFQTKLDELKAEKEAATKRFKEGGYDRKPSNYERDLNRIQKREEALIKGANRASAKKIKNLATRRDELLKRGFNQDAQEIQNQLDIELGSSYTSEGLQRLSLEIETKTPEQIDKAIDDGELQVTEEAAQETAQNLQDAGVKSIPDLAKLKNAKDRAIARAVILAMTKDETSRRALRTEINNVFETGMASYSAKDVVDDSINRDKNNLTFAGLKQDAMEWRAGVGKDVTTDLDALRKGINAIWYGEDGDETNLNKRTARQVVREYGGGLLDRIENAADAQSKLRYQKEYGAMISTAMASLASENKGSIAKKVLAWFRPSAKNSVQSTDFDISKVTPNYNSKGQIVSYTYRDQFGQATNTEITVGELRSVDENIADDLNKYMTKTIPFKKG